ncbi:site-specific DNA-methyltransferase [Thermoactinomyces sp. DSM 45892]|uniref:site-specific DNA-methyltransferase n=1 Tax=Thermoactinomyces sp. DSM 45892 TaxID=1882753 RepID=UPI00089A6B60|nr:site-specific DNA-methyltransferase [Thermoactinomyces sp. DSM 45892]SDY22652.1 DNA modification methylase [Thermoactinomyces sp. DSM 45892]
MARLFLLALFVKVMNMEIKKISINEINPATYNPRKDLRPGDPEYEKLKRSIEEFGFVEPLVWNQRTGRLVGGHQRFKILLEQGMTEVECSIVDLDESKEKALNIALNKIDGDWDTHKLAELLEDIQLIGLDVELTGFDSTEIDKIMSDFLYEMEPEEDDFDLEVELEKIEEPITQKGDLWILGKHRLLCGDATSSEDLNRLMDGQLANMVFVDPPYNVGYIGKTKDALTIQNDKMGNQQFYQFLFDAFSNMYAVTHPGGGIYICHADSEGINFRTAMVNAGWDLKQCIVWVKNTIVLGRQYYQWKHEPILYGWKPGKAHQWMGDRKQSTVWEFDKPSRSKDHPTMKPVGIPMQAIKNSSPVDGIILDSFLGSGSTLIAAEQTNRICYGLELDPRYCDVIVKRWEKHTGNNAERIPKIEN